MKILAGEQEGKNAVLFLLRPRQTRMPYQLPRNATQQDAYNRNLQQSFAATRRVTTPEPTATAPRHDTLAELRELGQLHTSGALSDEEFARAKAKVLGTDASGS